MPWQPMHKAMALSKFWPSTVLASGGLLSLLGALSGGGFGWACAASATALPMRILTIRPDMTLFCCCGSRRILTQKKAGARAPACPAAAYWKE
jgi:hypothetical protein